MNKPLVLAALLAGGLVLLPGPTSLQAARRGCGGSFGAYRAPQYRYYRAPAYGAYSSRPYHYGGYYPYSGAYYSGATFSFGFGHGHYDFGHHYGHHFSHHGGHHGHH